MSQIVDSFALLLPQFLLAAGVGAVLCALVFCPSVRAALAARRTAVPVRIDRDERPRHKPLEEEHAFAPAIVVTRYPTRGPPTQSPQRLVRPDRWPGS